MQLYKNFQPVVSIVLPTFNRENYLKRSIDSVLNQTYKLWELLVIDDGSNDNTFEIVKNYSQELVNIRYLFHSNRGLPISLNTGIQASNGKYVTFLGSDDKYLPEHLELRVNYMIENKVDFINGGVEIIGNPFVKDKNDFSKMIHLKDCVIGGTFFGKREIFLKLNGFKNLKYSEDSEFFERLIKKYEVKKVDFPTYRYYRDTPDSICNQI